jgi:hypothetical protein
MFVMFLSELSYQCYDYTKSKNPNFTPQVAYPFHIARIEDFCMI